MEDFTFVALTYNQEDYILNHMESIRYQINNYGKGRRVDFILADDCSSDRTVETCKRWIDSNRELFCKVKICVSETNRGTVRNYESALHEIESNKFKIIGGDDLYYKEDVFKAAEQGQFVLCPVICFENNMVQTDTYDVRWWTYKECIRKRDKHLKESIKKRMHVKNCINAIGTFWDHELADENLYEILEKFTWIDDYPTWMYLLEKEDVIPNIYTKPIVLYRIGNGISLSRGRHRRNMKFDTELRAQYNYFGSPFGKIPRKFHPYAYWYYFCYFLKAFWYFVVLDHLDEDLRKFKFDMKKSCAEASEYLEYISESANESMNRLRKEE